MKRIFRLKNGKWIYSDGSKLLVESELKLKKPTKEERGEILKGLNLLSPSIEYLEEVKKIEEIEEKESKK